MLKNSISVVGSFFSVICVSFCLKRSREVEREKEGFYQYGKLEKKFAGLFRRKWVCQKL